MAPFVRLVNDCGPSPPAPAAGAGDEDCGTLGDAYEYLLGQFAAGSGKKAGEFYTPQRISDILSAIVTLDYPGQKLRIPAAQTVGQRA